MPGLLASGILGGIGAAGVAGGEYVAKSGLLEQQGAQALDLEKLRDELAGKRAQALESLKSHVVAPGSTLRTPGQPDFTAPEKSHPKEQLDYWTSHAEEARARAEALRKATNTKDLPASVKAYTDTIGKSLQALDKEEAGGMLGPDGKASLEKRRAALNAQLIVALSAGQLPDAAGPAGGQADPLGIRSALPKRTPATAPAAAASPTAPPSAPGLLSTQISDVPGGTDVDSARARLSAAQSKLQSFGLKQQKRDPAGFEAAKREAEEAKIAADSALAAYQGGVESGAARFRPR